MKKSEFSGIPTNPFTLVECIKSFGKFVAGQTYWAFLHEQVIWTDDGKTRNQLSKKKISIHFSVANGC